MSNEQVKALMQCLYDEAMHAGNLAIIDEVFSTGFIDHSTPGQAVGCEGVKDYFRAVRQGFPDMRVTIDEMVAEGNTLALRTTWRGTHLGRFEDQAPTGKQVERTLMQFFHFKNGLIVEEWNEGQGLL